MKATFLGVVSSCTKGGESPYIDGTIPDTFAYNSPQGLVQCCLDGTFDTLCNTIAGGVSPNVYGRTPDGFSYQAEAGIWQCTLGDDRMWDPTCGWLSGGVSPSIRLGTPDEISYVVQRQTAHSDLAHGGIFSHDCITLSTPELS